MKFLIVFTFFLIAVKVYGTNFQDFDVYQHQLTYQEVENKIKVYLQKDASIAQFYKLTPNTLSIGDLSHQPAEYILHLATDPQVRPQTISPGKTLNQLKIAIDPGHFGGLFAEVEERYVKIPSENTREGRLISFNEGELTYLTAIALKSLLEAEGAVVFITRSGVGKGVIKENFFQWLEKSPALWAKNEPLSKLFRIYYNKQDLIARAQAINSFSPDITVIIHYNAHLSEAEKDQNSVLTQSNYNLVFIPGAFCANELNTPQDRYEFLRLIVTDTIERSLQLSSSIIARCVDQLHVPLIGDDEKNSYLEKLCLKQQPGVYSRNLALTRLVHSPLCYGETLVQNNTEEIYRLSVQDSCIANQPCPKRLNEVAQAYFLGIKEYFEGQQGYIENAN